MRSRKEIDRFVTHLHTHIHRYVWSDLLLAERDVQVLGPFEVTNFKSQDGVGGVGVRGRRDQFGRSATSGLAQFRAAGGPGDLFLRLPRSLSII